MSEDANRKGQYIICSYSEWKELWEKVFKDVDPEFSSLHLEVIKHLDQLKVQEVIVEFDYWDEEYASAYSRFYATFFRPPHKLCGRHLFFRHSFKDPADLDEQEVAKSFCGFVITWPTSPPVIGGGALTFPSDVDIRVTSPHKVHIAGREFTLDDSVMFASKDHGVSVCATITTWLACSIMHRRYNLRTASSAEVTLIATGQDPRWGRAIPQSRGLDAEQMVRALSTLGYGPYIYTPVGVRRFPWIGYLYGYLSSGIPVIILLDVVPENYRHVVLAVGLRLHEKEAEEEYRTDSISLTFSRTVKDIVIHDDRWGLYATLKPDSPESTAAKINYYHNPPRDVTITGLIVPLPSSVTLLSENAHAFGSSWIQKQFQKQGKGEFKGTFRTLLQQSVEFKSLTQGWPEEEQEMAELFRQIAMPQWIWITEAYPDNVKTLDKDSEPIARTIVDSTVLRFDKGRLFLASHVENQVVIPKPPVSKKELLKEYLSQS